MNTKFAALFGAAVLAMSTSAFADTQRQVKHVYAGRTVVPVIVERQDQSQPYALTGQQDRQVKKVEPIKVGSRTVGYRTSQGR